MNHTHNWRSLQDGDYACTRCLVCSCHEHTMADSDCPVWLQEHERDCLVTFLADNSSEVQSREYGPGTFFSMTPDELADIILAGSAGAKAIYLEGDTIE